MSRPIALLTALILGVTAPFQALQAQDLGGLARLDPTDSGITDARWGKGASIELALSQGVPWRLFTLDKPHRLVLDFREVDWGTTRAEDLDRAEAVTELRMGAYRAYWSRLVAVLNGPYAVTEAGLSVDESAGTARLKVALQPTEPERFAAKAGAPRDPRWDLPPPAPVRAMPRGGVEGLLPHVVLDPGHGGIDPGAEHGGATEADLMLTFARERRGAAARWRFRSHDDPRCGCLRFARGPRRRGT